MPKKAKFDPVLFEKLFRKSQEYAKASKKNKPIAEKWFTIANDDINITKILYKNKHFAGSVYHLQQAFEKLIKGYYILSGRENPEKVGSHLYVTKKLKSEIKDEYINTFLELSKSVNDNEVKLDSAEQALNIFDKSEDEIRLLDKQNLLKILELIKKLESVLMNIETIQKTEEKLQEKNFIRMVKHLILKITTFRVRESDVKEAIRKEQVVFYLKSAVISIKLQMISLFTFLHFNSPRYPYDNKKNNATKVTYFDYKKDLGIVSLIPEMITIFDEIYQDMILEVNENSKNKP